MSAVTKSISQSLTTWTDQWPTYDGYDSLDTEIREIRLLDLKLSNSGLVSMHLRHVSLDDSPEYCALSYSWGPPVTRANQRVVLVNTIETHVRPTLADFLRNLVSLTGPLTVWLDAICINQRDLDEKKEQVIMMGDIYSKASRTYAWLGDGSPETDYICQSLNQRVFSVPDDAYMSYVQHILQRPYWYRMWIVQEYALSRETVLVIGNYLVPVEELRHCIPEELSKDSTLAALDLTRAGTHHRDYLFPPLKRLSDLIYLHRKSQCSDRRDKVYSLLSLTRTVIEPDYTVSPAQLIFYMTYEMVLSFNNWPENWVREGHLQSFRKLCLCIEPSMEEMFLTMQLEDMTFDVQSRLDRIIDSVETSTGSIPLEESGACTDLDYCFHKSFVFDGTTHLFELPFRYLHNSIHDFVGSKENPISHFAIAVSGSRRQITVGFRLDLLGLHDRIAYGSGSRITADDACLLAEILSKGIACCHSTEIGYYTKFHISQLVFVVFSLSSFSGFPSYHTNSHNTEQILDERPTLIQLLHGFLIRFRDSTSIIGEVSCTCNEIKTNSLSVEATSDPSAVFSFEEMGIPSWVREILLTDIDSYSSDLMTPAQTLVENGFLPCKIVSDAFFSSTVTIYERVSQHWDPLSDSERTVPKEDRYVRYSGGMWDDDSEEDELEPGDLLED